MPDVPLLGQDAARQRAAVDAPAAAKESGPPEIVQVHTAFIVFQTLDGQTMVTADLNAPLVTARIPSPDELYGMLSVAVKDIQNQEAAVHTANTTVEVIQEKQRQAVVDAQNAAIKAHLEKQGGL